MAGALRELLADPHAEATDGYASLGKGNGSWSGDLEQYLGGENGGKCTKMTSLFPLQHNRPAPSWCRVRLNFTGPNHKAAAEDKQQERLFQAINGWT